MPLLTSLAVLTLLFMGRVSSGREAMTPDPSLRHRLVPSLVAATWPFLQEVLALDAAPATGRDLLRGGIAKALFFAGSLACCLRVLPSSVRSETAGRYLGALAASGVVAAYVSIAAANYQFGAVCCERHAAMRHCLLLLAIVSLAGALAISRRQPTRRTGSIGAWAAAAAPVALALAAIAALQTSGPRLLSDYRDYSRLRAAWAQTWASGTGAGSTMTFHQSEPGRFVGGVVVLPASTYVLDDPLKDPGWWVTGVMRFFRKREVRFIAPEAALPALER